MRSVGHECALRADELGEPAGHVVETDGEPTNLRRSIAHGYRRGQIATRERVDRALDRADRSCH